ncbi:hypothetical protein SH139x_005186 [Planctomycetaceae bacterium SH139]
MNDSTPSPNDDDDLPVMAQVVVEGPTIGRQMGQQKRATISVAGDDADEDPLGRFGRSKVAILVTVFLVAGILGLPLIYVSRAFNRLEKVFWTVVVLLYTVALFYGLYLYVIWLFDRVSR